MNYFTSYEKVNWHWNFFISIEVIESNIPAFQAVFMVDKSSLVLIKTKERFDALLYRHFALSC